MGWLDEPNLAFGAVKLAVSPQGHVIIMNKHRLMLIKEGK
jgi:hypothetical protein